jgi:hypothetical protein
VISGNANGVPIGLAGVGGGGPGGVAVFEFTALRPVVEEDEEVTGERTPGEDSVSVAEPSESSSQESATFLFLGLRADLVDLEAGEVEIVREEMALVTSVVWGLTWEEYWGE